jgi:hypothetical protein
MRRRFSPARKFIEQNREARFQRLGEPYTAPFGIYYQRVTLLAERNRGVPAYKPKWYLRPNASAPPHRFERLRNQGHKSLLRLYVA